MRKVRFNLQSKKTDKAYIYLVFRFHKERLMYCTPYKVSPKNWLSSKQRVSSKEAFSILINSTLDKVAFKIEEHINLCMYSGKELDFKEIKGIADKIFKKKQPQAGTQEGPIEWIERFLRENPKFLSESTLKSQKSIFHKVRSFRAVKEWSEIDQNYVDQLARHLVSTKELNKNTAHNCLKTFCAWMAFAKKDHEVAEISPSFSPIQTENVYLTEDELDKIYLLEGLTKAEEIARDRFIVGCYTGLRVSDFIKLSKDHFVYKNGQTFIEYRTQKSQKEIIVLIPVHSRVEEIFERLKKHAKNTLAEQVINRHIKNIAERAGINQEIILVKNKAGNQVEIKEPKFKHITTHTGRRTFITNSMAHKVPESVIMSVTGIRSTQTLMKYNKMEKERSAKIMGESEFFK